MEICPNCKSETPVSLKAGVGIGSVALRQRLDHNMRLEPRELADGGAAEHSYLGSVLRSRARRSQATFSIRSAAGGNVT